MKLPLVVSPQQINGASNNDLKIVDLRPLEAFEQGHLPGALHLDAGLLNHAEPPVGGLLPDAESVNLVATKLGLQPGDHVLAYDQGAATAAARLIWVLHAYGFNATSWLNGGYNAWSTAGLPTSVNVTETKSGAPSALQFTAGNVLSVDELMSELNNDQVKVQVLDVRSTNEFNGTDVRSARGGHVPNALHSEWTDVFDASGTLKSDEALTDLFSSLGVVKDKPVVVYCQTHQRSALTYVVLKHLQYESVSAIDGAWSAWGNRTDTPIDS